MELGRLRLSKFDLEQELEKQLLHGNAGELGRFLSVTQEIQTVDQFIRECPSFPGSTDKIIRDELVSAVGATLAIEGTILGTDEIEQSFAKADLNEQLKRKEQEAENSRNAYN